MAGFIRSSRDRCSRWATTTNNRCKEICRKTLARGHNLKLAKTANRWTTILKPIRNGLKSGMLQPNPNCTVNMPLCVRVKQLKLQLRRQATLGANVAGRCRHPSNRIKTPRVSCQIMVPVAGSMEISSSRRDMDSSHSSPMVINNLSMANSNLSMVSSNLTMASNNHSMVSSNNMANSPCISKCTVNNNNNNKDTGSTNLSNRSTLLTTRMVNAADTEQRPTWCMICVRVSSP